MKEDSSDHGQRTGADIGGADRIKGGLSWEQRSATISHVASPRFAKVGSWGVLWGIVNSHKPLE